MAAKHDLVASFLPKLFPEEAASGRHCHFSLWRGDVNLLAHEAAPAAAAAGTAAPPPGKGSPAVQGLCPEGEAFLAGVLQHLPALMVFTTPSPNSYRRLAPHCWAGAFQVCAVAWYFGAALGEHGRKRRRVLHGVCIRFALKRRQAV